MAKARKTAISQFSPSWQEASSFLDVDLTKCPSDTSVPENLQDALSKIADYIAEFDPQNKVDYLVKLLTEFENLAPDARKPTFGENIDLLKPIEKIGELEMEGEQLTGPVEGVMADKQARLLNLLPDPRDLSTNYLVRNFRSGAQLGYFKSLYVNMDFTEAQAEMSQDLQVLNSKEEQLYNAVGSWISKSKQMKQIVNNLEAKMEELSKLKQIQLADHKNTFQQGNLLSSIIRNLFNLYKNEYVYLKLFIKLGATSLKSDKERADYVERYMRGYDENLLRVEERISKVVEGYIKWMEELETMKTRNYGERLLARLKKNIDVTLAMDVGGVKGHSFEGLARLNKVQVEDIKAVLKGLEARLWEQGVIRGPTGGSPRETAKNIFRGIQLLKDVLNLSKPRQTVS